VQGAGVAELPGSEVRERIKFSARPLTLRFGRAAAAGGGRAAGGFVIEAAAVQKGGKVTLVLIQHPMQHAVSRMESGWNERAGEIRSRPPRSVP
jgi:hypothetical protein